MWMNLLTNSALPEGYQEVSIGTASLYALIGFLVVFAGIAFLIFVVWLVGQLMAKASSTQKPIKEKVEEKADIPVQSPPKTEEIDEETVAVMMAALTAYYETNYPKCEFTVKRIKRMRRNDYA